MTRENSTAYCITHYEAWGDAQPGPFSGEWDLIRQVKFLSPLGEAFVSIVQRGEPIWLDRFGHPPIRALRLEEECRATLDRYYHQLQDATPAVGKGDQPRRL